MQESVSSCVPLRLADEALRPLAYLRLVLPAARVPPSTRVDDGPAAALAAGAAAASLGMDASLEAEVLAMAATDAASCAETSAAADNAADFFRAAAAERAEAAAATAAAAAATAAAATVTSASTVLSGADSHLDAEPLPLSGAGTKTSPFSILPEQALQKPTVGATTVARGTSEPVNFDQEPAPLNDTTRSVTAALTWDCSLCTFANSGRGDSCAMCGTKRDGGAIAEPDPTPLAAAARWHCHACSASNVATAVRCSVCGTARSSGRWGSDV